MRWLERDSQPGFADLFEWNGVNSTQAVPFVTILTYTRFLSPDGRCYSFDEQANGYARGEGVGCIFLKRLDDALADGDTIRAIVRNSGSNQDGRTPGISFPSKIAQEMLTKGVYTRAGLDPLETSYVEAHGNGTQAGDPIETSAISAAIAMDRPIDKPLIIGSVKANIGHLYVYSGLLNCTLR
jgi:acyl transferase domain-containing protein